MRSLELNPDLSKVYTDPFDPDKEFYLPEKLDLMVTGACPMRCPGCWGPKHNSMALEMTPEQWMEIVYYVDMNNRADRFNISTIASDNATVCITGGEPLLYSGLVGLVNLLRHNRVHTTLSTTGIDPEGVLQEVLSGVQELGIPLDGADPEANSLWRQGKSEDGGYKAAIAALRIAQADFPGIQLTLRTMLHPGNLDSVSQIPDALEASGVDPGTINWKLYIHNTNTGPRRGHNDLLIDQAQIQDTAGLEDAAKRFRGVSLLSPSSQQDRLVINHDGAAHIVLPDGNGLTQDIVLGNIATDPSEVSRKINLEHPDFLARACGRGAIFRYFECVKAASQAQVPEPIFDALSRYNKSTSAITA